MNRKKSLESARKKEVSNTENSVLLSKAVLTNVISSTLSTLSTNIRILLPDTDTDENGFFVCALQDHY